MAITQHDFSDEDYWKKQLDYCVNNNVHITPEDKGIWQHFKYCLKTGNRFFNDSPLVPIIKERYQKHIYQLESMTILYRARIDKKEEYLPGCKLAQNLLQLKNSELDDDEKSSELLAKAIKEYWLSESKRIVKDEEYQKYLERKSHGFEGFNAKESGAPPFEKAVAGRCNPESVSFLYTSNDIHTAIAEVRPYFRDPISIAKVQIKNSLKLVDFYYEIDDNGFIIVDDVFWHWIRSEFSIINKGNANDYLITQYLTLLAEKEGFDGIHFRSSLVREGSNYVIFDKTNYELLSSKIHVVSDVTYDFFPIPNDTTNAD